MVLKSAARGRCEAPDPPELRSGGLDSPLPSLPLLNALFGDPEVVDWTSRGGGRIPPRNDLVRAARTGIYTTLASNDPAMRSAFRTLPRALACETHGGTGSLSRPEATRETRMASRAAGRRSPKSERLQHANKHPTLLRSTSPASVRQGLLLTATHPPRYKRRSA